MRNPHINTSIAGQGFLKTLETALKAPETFGMSEAEVARKMTLMAFVLALSKDTTNDLLVGIGSMELSLMVKCHPQTKPAPYWLQPKIEYRRTTC